MPIKTFGIWDCNITSQKLTEVFTLLKEHHSEELHSVEIVDYIHILKKPAVISLGELFQSLKTLSKKSSLAIKGCSAISPKNMNLLFTLLSQSRVRNLVLD